MIVCLPINVRRSILLAAGLALGACGTEPDTTSGALDQNGAALHGAPECKDGFELTSPAFADGAPLPAANTCEGQPFGAGTSPKLEWKKPPPGTKSFAFVLKDLSIVNGDVPDHAYHWALWDLPRSFHELPQAIESTQFPAGLKGAQQLNGLPWAPYAYFGPCPSWENLCSGGTVPRTNDTYALVLYAFDQKQLTLPPADPNIANYVRQLDAYFQSIAIGQTQLGFTSDARPSAFPQLCP